MVSRPIRRRSMEPKDHTYMIRMSKSLFRALDEEAARRGVATSVLVRRALRDALGIRRRDGDDV